MRRDVRRDRAAGALPPRRVAAAGAVRPRLASATDPRSTSPAARRTCGATTSCCPSRRPEHVVTLGEGMTPLLPARGSAPSSACRACWSRTRGCSRPAPSRRAARPSASPGPASWARRGSRCRPTATPARPGPTYAARAGLRATIAMPLDAPAITRAEMRRRRRRPAPGRRADRRRRPAGRRGGRRPARTTGSTPSTLKEPYRIEGKKTMGLRDRRAARLADARRDPLPDRRRGRPDRHPQGAGRAARAGLGRRRPAAAGRGAVDRLRADRARRSTPARRSRRAVDGRARRSRSASPCPRRSATSSCSRRCARPAAPRSRSTTPTCWPTCALTGAARGPVPLPRGRGLPDRGPTAARDRLARAPTTRWWCSTPAPA